MEFRSKNTFIDFHTHRIRKQEKNDVFEIVSLHLGKEREHDYFTIGKHPWWTTTLLTADEKIKFLQEIQDPKCIAIGEMGLDKLKGESLEIQKEIFRELLYIAQDNNKPVIIHCVRAFDSLLKIKKEFPKIKNWCVHGFSRHAELASQLIRAGFYISIMPVKEVNPKYTELIQALPANKFFLETDSMPNTDIESIYLQVAKIRGISLEELQNHIIKNLNEFTSKKEL